MQAYWASDFDRGRMGRVVVAKWRTTAYADAYAYVAPVHTCDNVT